MADIKADAPELALLHESCRRGTDETAAELLAKKPPLLNARGQMGNTALHWAAGGEDASWRTCALVWAPTAARCSLCRASAAGHASMVTLLLKRGATVNSQNDMKDTPLHLAAWRDHLDVVKLLLEAGADKTATNAVGVARRSSPLARAPLTRLACPPGRKAPGEPGARRRDASSASRVRRRRDQQVHRGRRRRGRLILSQRRADRVLQRRARLLHVPLLLSPLPTPKETNSPKPTPLLAAHSTTVHPSLPQTRPHLRCGPNQFPWGPHLCQRVVSLWLHPET